MSELDPMRPVPIPAVAVKLTAWLCGILGSGAMGTLLIMLNRIFMVGDKLSELERRLSAAEVKQADHGHVLNEYRDWKKDVERYRPKQ